MVADFVDDFVVSVSAEDAEAVVTVVGELDMATAPKLRDAFVEVLATSPSRLVVAADQLTFVDSTGLSVLLLAARRCAEQGGRLVLREPTDVLRRLIFLAGVGQLLAVEGDPAGAP